MSSIFPFPLVRFPELKTWETVVLLIAFSLVRFPELKTWESNFRFSFSAFGRILNALNLLFRACSSFLPCRLLLSPPPSSFYRQTSFSPSQFQIIVQCVWADSKRTKSFNVFFQCPVSFFNSLIFVSVSLFISLSMCFRFQLDSPERILVKAKGEKAKSKSTNEFRSSSSY